jgi:hypothetical protein
MVGRQWLSDQGWAAVTETNLAPAEALRQPSAGANHRRAGPRARAEDLVDNRNIVKGQR